MERRAVVAARVTVKVPIVLIHGALRSRAGLLPTAWWFQRQGFAPHVFGYAARADPLERHAERLHGFLVARLGGRPVPVLGFLTHSMGALVVRRFLALEGEPLAEDHRIVMLSPPNRGATLAHRHRGSVWLRGIYGRAAQELQPARVAELPAPRVAARVLILAGGSSDGRGYHPGIAGDDDGVVALADMPLQGAALERVGGVHALLQWRPAVLRRAARFLADGA